MATLHQAQHLLSSSSSCHQKNISAMLHTTRPTNLRTTKINNKEQLISLQQRDQHTAMPEPAFRSQDDNHMILLSKLYAIAEAAADRAEMHAIIGEQRNNWGHLLLNSTNSITLTASLMAGISAIPESHPFALKLSSALLFTAAAGMMAVTNKIQPSQLAEEQRNATRLFRQIEKSIHTTLAIKSTPTEDDVRDAMERVLALDKAYPLPLLPGMLEKFPESVEPTVWWPKLKRRGRMAGMSSSSNGWSKQLEEEMKGVLRVVKKKDSEEYLRFGRLVLQINKILAVSGPVLAGLAAVGAGLSGTPVVDEWAVLVAVVGGALAATVNTLEHGGQVGMVFELCRNCTGFYKGIEEEIEGNLGEREVERRENGELFEMKLALQLGRSLQEMKDLKAYASLDIGEDVHEFAGKLF